MDPGEGGNFGNGIWDILIVRGGGVWLRFWLDESRELQS